METTEIRMITDLDKAVPQSIDFNFEEVKAWLSENLAVYNTVSIEMVSHTDASGTYYIPEKTMENAARLYQMLLPQLPNVQAAIRHYDVSGKLCPLPLINEEKWEKFQKLLKEVDEVVEKSKIIVDGKEVAVDRILKDGTNYVKVRDIAAALDLKVSNKGNIAVLETKK